MTVAFYMNCVSAHVLPLAKCVSRLIGCDNFTYVSCDEKSESAQRANAADVSFEIKSVRESREILLSANLVYAGLRDVELFEKRRSKGLTTFYGSERWLKPFDLGVGSYCWCNLSGWVRMLIPGYRRKVQKFKMWLDSDTRSKVLAIGPWAKKDFLTMGISLDKIVDWGYYVEPSHALPAEKSEGTLRLLWCGRLLGWKRVGDIVRAVGEHVGLKRVGDSLPNISLTIVGDGPEKTRLVKLVQKLKLDGMVNFMSSQPIEKIREIMCEHDTFVLASNAYEGWGAVVSEALEERMNVIGTYESGAASTLLPKERLYHCGDVKALARLIEKECRGELPPCSIGEWTAEKGALRLLNLAKI